MLSNSLEVRPSGGGVGAFVEGLDLRELGKEDAAKLKTALGDYGVLFFRGQDISTDQHLAVAEHFGGVNVNRFFAHVPEEPRIAEVRKEPDQKANIGGGWHTDHSYDVEPALGSILVARELPETGGDTRFASMYRAYDTLPDDLRKQIEGKRAIHSARHIFGTAEDSVYNQMESDNTKKLGNSTAADVLQDVAHPIAITHPLSGKKALYVNPAFTIGIEGMNDQDGKALLFQLYAHAMNMDHACQFSWKPGSVAFWDNRATWHWALNDYHGQRRVMHRITIEGCPLH